MSLCGPCFMLKPYLKKLLGMSDTISVNLEYLYVVSMLGSLVVAAERACHV